MRPDPPTQASAAPYFLEEVRKELEARYGAKQLYENGLSIQTALDLHLQEAATAAIDAGLRRVDKRHGFRKPKRNVIAEGHTRRYLRATRGGIGPWRPATSSRPSSLRSREPTILARAGTLRVTIDRKRLRVDGQERPQPRS